MNNFCIITNIPKDKDLRMTKLIKNWLELHNKKVYIPDELAKLLGETNSFSKVEDIAGKVDCAIILGGDGSILVSAREFALQDVPIVGVNLGTLGFLAEIEKEDVISVLENIINKKFIIENRMMIAVEVIRDGEVINRDIALNDAVITRDGASRIVHLKSFINSELLDAYEADGVIVCTPTGSTAYNLSAGGPILHHDSEMMAITPICPHTLTSRSIVVSAKDTITILVDNIRKKTCESNLLSLDGQVNYEVIQGDIIKITKSDLITKLLILNRKNFYEILRTKIGMTKEV
ncbi:MAG: kinase [Clostridiales bacterium]|jgi:NAD+ kinase|nr:kinase [Clostridiales bacterium]